MTEIHNFVRVDFSRFKAFHTFTLQLRHFNILVGPNNAGKSTILTAFRILYAAMRKASTRKPEIIKGPNGMTRGYAVDLAGIAVSEENIFYNYDDSEPALVTFRISNKNTLTLYFPERGSCYLILDAPRPILSPANFQTHFKCAIGFVPILGPVEHNERLFEKEAARQALFNYRAARNFRNIWYHYPDRFQAFRDALIQTWPGMDVQPPFVDTSHERARLHMFCLEQRMTREIFWSGFGFQVWCQMLTHLIQAGEVALFLIDEPDIYLHSDLQRQLVSLLRNMSADILIATHSTEIVTEAEADDIVLVSKTRKSWRRIKNPAELHSVFSVLGSNLNPVLTQLAKTRRVIFVEGKDFLIISKFARLLGFHQVANRSDFAVVPVEGFNPDRIRSLKAGMEATLGRSIAAAALLDKDYRSDAERAAILRDCEDICDFITIHRRKEIENFLLVASALDRACERKVVDRAKRGGERAAYVPTMGDLLEQFCASKRTYVLAQYLENGRRFARANSPSLSDATVSERVLTEFDPAWCDSRLELVPGKEALSFINQHVQAEYGVALTATAVLDTMRRDEVPEEMSELIGELAKFAASKPRSREALAA